MNFYQNSPDRFITPLSHETVVNTDVVCSDSCDNIIPIHRYLTQSQLRHSQSFQRGMFGVPHSASFSRGQTRTTSQLASPSKSIVMQGFITPPSSPRATNVTTPETNKKSHTVFSSPQTRPSSQHSPVTPSTPLNGFRIPPPRSPYLVVPSTSSDPNHFCESQALYPYKYLDAPNLSDEGCTSSMVAFGADGTYAVALGNALYWSGHDETPVLLCEDNVVITALCVSRDWNNYLLIGLSNGLIHPMRTSKDNTYECSVHQTVKSLPTISDNVSPITALCVRNHELISGNADGKLTFYDLQSGMCKCTYSVGVVDDPLHFPNSFHSRALILSLDATSDGNHVAVATTECLMVYHRYNMCEPTLLRVRESQPRNDLSARSLAWCEGFNVDTGLAYAKGVTGTTLCLQSVGESVRAEGDLGYQILLLVAGTTGTTLIVSHGDAVESTNGGRSPRDCPRNLTGTLGVYTILLSEKKFRLILRLVGHNAPILHAAVSVDGATLVSGAGGADSTIRFWEILPSKTCGSLDCYEDELR